MNIAITTTGATMDSTVFPEFAQAPFLLIVDADTMTGTAILHAPGPDSDLNLARIILEHDCEAVITGSLTEGAFTVLAERHVTRYAAGDMTARQAMEDRELELIRNVDGSPGCSTDHNRGFEHLRVCDGQHH